MKLLKKLRRDNQHGTTGGESGGGRGLAKRVKARNEQTTEVGATGSATGANAGTDLARREDTRDLAGRGDLFSHDPFAGFFDRLWNDRFLTNPWASLNDLTAGWGGLGNWPSFPSLFGGRDAGRGSGVENLANWPPVDVAEDEKSLTLRVDLPGIDPKDLDVEIAGNSLTIRGCRQDEWSDEKSGVYRRERRCGSFSRTLPLPPYVEADKVDARYDKGTLTLSIPKVPGKGPRRVNVSST